MEILLADRVAQLQAMHWKKQKAIADSLGLEKPEDIDWDEFCDDIAKAENDDKKLTEPLLPPVVITPTDVVTVLVDARIYTPHGNICHVCFQKLRTDENGFICPILDAHCPRNREIK